MAMSENAADIIRDLEKDGLMLGGALGANPNTIRNYLNSLGFDASHAQKIDRPRFYPATFNPPTGQFKKQGSLTAC